MWAFPPTLFLQGIFIVFLRLLLWPKSATFSAEIMHIFSFSKEKASSVTSIVYTIAVVLFPVSGFILDKTGRHIYFSMYFLIVRFSFLLFCSNCCCDWIIIHPCFYDNGTKHIHIRSLHFDDHYWCLLFSWWLCCLASHGIVGRSQSDWDCLWHFNVFSKLWFIGWTNNSGLDH